MFIPHYYKMFWQYLFIFLLIKEIFYFQGFISNLRQATIAKL